MAEKIYERVTEEYAIGQVSQGKMVSSAFKVWLPDAEGVGMPLVFSNLSRKPNTGPEGTTNMLRARPPKRRLSHVLGYRRRLLSLFSISKYEKLFLAWLWNALLSMPSSHFWLGEVGMVVQNDTEAVGETQGAPSVTTCRLT